MKYLSNVATLEYFPEKCGGCGRCTEVCPHGVFVLSERAQGRRAEITDRDRCMECGACARNCESEAIRVKSGVGCAAAIFNSMKKGGTLSCDCG